MVCSSEKKHYDVIIIGGGITGAGTARDCAMRGLKTLLVERFDFTAGATGRNHGLLHSGARYAVTDKESAAECIGENMILRRIARHCVEDTQGLFVTLPEDDLGYQKRFVESCIASGIKAEVIDPAEARILEPSVNPAIIGAVRVPDGAVDPFRLTVSNIIDAVRHGADVLTFHEVESLIVGNGKVSGVRMLDKRTKRSVSAYSDVVINAAGIWGHLIAKKAGITINMFPAKGALLIFGHRINNMVINRCRKPADADILVPGDTISLIGTTSSRVSYDEIDEMRATRQEVDLLLREGSQIAPSLATTRIIRAYAGVRPLVAADNDPSGRSISRGIICLDHAVRDGLEGFITITGGKLMTYRLMAEKATDMTCAKLCCNEVCRTAQSVLPGSDSVAEPKEKGKGCRLAPDQINVMRAVHGRHGSLSGNVVYRNEADRTVVCECEQVSVGEIHYAMTELHADCLASLRRRTRLGMGTCQGELCACRAAGVMAALGRNPLSVMYDLKNFISERWKGMEAVCWGETLAEAQFMQWLYVGVCGIDRIGMLSDSKQTVQ